MINSYEFAKKFGLLKSNKILDFKIEQLNIELIKKSNYYILPITITLINDSNFNIDHISLMESFMIGQLKNILESQTKKDIINTYECYVDDWKLESSTGNTIIFSGTGVAKVPK